jgi:DHA1 family bicyclomycin/chloramphenicol resistance-like MFS transporter
LGWQAIFLGVAIYAVLLLALYVRFVPETRSGAWNDIAFGTLFSQCHGVLLRRIDGRLLPLRYAAAMALGASVMMNFVTNSSFVYMDYFGVSSGQFPLLFAASVLGFMAMNTFSMRRLNDGNSEAFFRAGLRLQLVGVVLLLFVIGLDLDTLWTVVPCIVLIVSTLGLVTPAGSARYLGFFSQLAGTASSIYTAMMFIGGGAFGALTGLMFDGSLLPLAVSMLISALLANGLILGLPKPKGEESSPGSV